MKVKIQCGDESVTCLSVYLLLNLRQVTAVNWQLLSNQYIISYILWRLLESLIFKSTYHVLQFCQVIAWSMICISYSCGHQKTRLKMMKTSPGYTYIPPQLPIFTSQLYPFDFPSCHICCMTDMASTSRISFYICTVELYCKLWQYW